MLCLILMNFTSILLQIITMVRSSQLNWPCTTKENIPYQFRAYNLPCKVDINCFNCCLLSQPIIYQTFLLETNWHKLVGDPPSFSTICSKTCDQGKLYIVHKNNNLSPCATMTVGIMRCNSIAIIIIVIMIITVAYCNDNHSE